MTAFIPTTGLRAAFPSETVIVMDAPVWLFALGVSLISAIAFGLAPSIAITRVPLADAIKTQGGPGISAGRAQRRFRQILVVAEVALAFVLLTGATLLIQGFFTLTDRLEARFDSTNVLTAGLPTPATRFDSGVALNAYLDEMARRIHGLPGIRNVAFADALPTQGSRRTGRGSRYSVNLPPPSSSERTLASRSSAHRIFRLWLFAWSLAGRSTSAIETARRSLSSSTSHLRPRWGPASIRTGFLGRAAGKSPCCAARIWTWQRAGEASRPWDGTSCGDTSWSDRRRGTLSCSDGGP